MKTIELTLTEVYGINFLEEMMIAILPDLPKAQNLPQLNAEQKRYLKLFDEVKLNIKMILYQYMKNN